LDKNKVSYKLIYKYRNFNKKKADGKKKEVAKPFTKVQAIGGR